MVRLFCACNKHGVWKWRRSAAAVQALVGGDQYQRNIPGFHRQLHHALQLVCNAHQLWALAGVDPLEGKAAIPMVADRLELILEVQTDDFWQDVSVVRLDTVRKQLRGLVKFIEKIGQKSVYTNFEDEAGEGIDINLPIGGGPQSFERFKEKVRHFLRPRENELVMQKLRLGLGLTKADIKQLDHMLVAAELGPDDNYQAARQGGLGVFVQSLVGLDRSAAMKAFGGFLQKYALNSRQQEFIALVIEELTRTGIVERSRLFYDPFTGLAPTGVQGLFSDEQMADLYDALDRVRNQARETTDASG